MNPTRASQALSRRLANALADLTPADAEQAICIASKLLAIRAKSRAAARTAGAASGKLGPDVDTPETLPSEQ